MYKDYVSYVEDILDSMQKLVHLTGSIMYVKFEKDLALTLAVERLFEKIGEAASCIPEDLKIKYQDISWVDMVEMKDNIIKGSDKANISILWKTIQTEVPRAKLLLNEMKEELDT